MNILQQIRKKKILVIGDIILDRFIYGHAERLSPEAPIPVVRALSEKFSAGGAANVAKNLTALGVEAILAGVVGRDYWGKFARKLFSKSGIKTDLIKQVSDRPTTIKTRVIAQKQQVVRLDTESNSPINPNLFIQDIGSIIKNADGIIIADYGKGMMTKKLIVESIRYALKMKKIITVDPQVEHFFLYKNVTSLTPNHNEASRATGMPAETDAEVKKTGRFILKKLKTKSLLITRGEKGMTVFEKNKTKNIPTQAREVFDVTGAGDTVIAIFTLCLACGFSLEEAAAVANKAAGIVVGKFGTATLTPEEFSRCV